MAKRTSSPVEQPEQAAPQSGMMDNSRAIVRAFITIAVLVGLYLMIRKLSGVLLPFVVSLLIAYILDPLVRFFQVKCRLKNRLLSVIVTLMLVIGTLVGSVAALVPAIRTQVRTVSASIQQFAEDFNATDYISEDMNARLQDAIEGMDLYTIIRTKDFQQTLKNILPTVGNWISSGLSALAGVAVVFICLLYIIFILMDMDRFRDEWINYVPKKFRRKAMMLAEDLDRNLNAYFRGQAMIALMVGILFAIGFQLIGLPMGIAMGLIIGVLNLVPYMQALGIPPCIILALIQSAESGRPVWLCLLLVAVVFIVVQTLQDLVLTPRIMGDAMGLTPAVILLALCVWGALFGVLGMIMALPLTTLMLSYYKRFVVDQEDVSQA